MTANNRTITTHQYYTTTYFTVIDFNLLVTATVTDISDLKLHTCNSFKHWRESRTVGMSVTVQADVYVIIECYI